MNRRRVLLVAVALLYIGLLMIGMSGRGLPGFATILALMLLYTVLMRPAVQWSGPGLAGAIRFAATVAVLAVLSGILWLVGLVLLQWVDPVPVWNGVAVAAAGIALSRGVWSAQKEAPMDAFLDDALAQVQGVAAPADAAGVLQTRLEDEARWNRLSAVVSQVHPALTLARAQALAATLGPDLDRALYREAMLDLSELRGAGAVRMRVALMARHEVMPWWDDAYSAVSLLGRALDQDGETAALAARVAERWLSAPAVDLAEAAALRQGLEARRSALPPNDPLRAPLEGVLARFREGDHD